MAQYIDKDALVAEIEKRIKETESMQPKFDQFWAGQISAFKGVLKILDTLEVKGVDFEREMQAFAKINLEPLVISDSNIGISITMSQLYGCAKHFFELGMSVSNKALKVNNMTDKEKIRAEIERRIEELQPCNTRENLRAHGAIAGYYQILSFIDSMQEEPKFKTGDRIKPIDSCLGSPCTIVNVCDSWYVTDQGTLDFEYEDNWELVEEPVSDDFEEALAKEWKGYVDRGAATVDALEDNTQELTFAKGFYRGAKWQKAKNESTSKDLREFINELSKQFPELSFAKLSRIAVRVAKWKEQQLMANAVEGVVHHFEKCGVASVHYNDPTGVPMAYFTSPEGLSAGDKVKIIEIKED